MCLCVLRRKSIVMCWLPSIMIFVSWSLLKLGSRSIILCRKDNKISLIWPQGIACQRPHDSRITILYLKVWKSRPKTNYFKTGKWLSWLSEYKYLLYIVYLNTNHFQNGTVSHRKAENLLQCASQAQEPLWKFCFMQRRISIWLLTVDWIGCRYQEM
jgi:hypothetical protein